MSRNAPLAAAILACASLAGAREQIKTFEVPGGGVVLPISSSLNLGLKLDPSLPLNVGALGLTNVAATGLSAKPGSVYVANVNAGLVPGKELSLMTLAPSQITAATPQTMHAMMAEAPNNGVNGSGEPERNQGDAGSMEDAALKARKLFDGMDTRAARLERLHVPVAGSEQAAKYAKALDDANEEGFTPERTTAVIDAAEALFAKMGVKTERLRDKNEPGLRIAAEKGISELNDMAADVFAALGTRSDYLPSVTARSTALFMNKQNRIALASINDSDFYLAYLHELRHAWYTSLIQKGDIRLFHMHMYARPGMRIAPDARSYAGYVTFEELSTYPKTLKHLIVEMKRAEPKARRRLERLAETRIKQYAELIKTAEYLGNMLGKIEKRIPDNIERMEKADYDKVQIRRSEFADWFQLMLPQGSFFIPAPKREKKNFIGFTSRKGDHDEAAQRIALAMRLINEMSIDLVPFIVSYHEAVGAGDWEKAGAMAGKMVVRVAQAEKAWAAAQP